MKLNRIVLLSVALLAFGLPAFAQESTPAATSVAGEQIVIPVPGLLPEGVEYDAAGGRFLFGSLTQGTIRQVTDDGTVSTFVEDKDITSSVGLQVDAARNRLLVASSDVNVFFDTSVKGKAGLAAYDLTTGKRLFYVDLAAVASDGKDFANDVAVDADGNAYVTNSFTPVIYKVDPSGKGSVFLRDDRFTGSPVGLNGIDVSPDGYLLAAVDGSASIFKIPLDNPAGITEVKLSEPFGADGMALAPNGTLYAVAAFVAKDGTTTQQIVAVTSSDNWASAQIQARVDTGGNSSTLALRDGAPWYINDYLNNPQATQYEIIRAQLEAG